MTTAPAMASAAVEGDRAILSITGHISSDADKALTATFAALTELAEQGQAAWPAGGKEKAKQPKPKPSKGFEQKQKRLTREVRQRLDEMPCEQIDRMLGELAEVAGA